MRKLTTKIAKLVLRPLRPVIFRSMAAYEKYRLTQPDYLYNAWATANQDRCYVTDSRQGQTLISIVVPVYNPPHAHLLEMVYSVVNQHYGNWELILVNASSEATSRQQVEACGQIDKRIKVVSPSQNEGIAGNTNFGLKQAVGDFVAFVDHDDLLHPCALHMVAAAMKGRTPPDLIYSDEDKVTHDSERFFAPFYKPDFSPDLLHNVNYINHLTVIRRDHVDKVGGLRPACDGAQDYDLLLRVIDQTQPVIKHIRKVLYHWRAAETSTAQNISNKEYIFKAGEKALRDHLKRQNIPALVKAIENRPGFYRLAYQKVNFTVVVGSVSVYRRQAVARWIHRLWQDLAEQPGDVSTELIVGAWFKEYMKTGPASVPLRLVADDDDYWKNAVKLVSQPVTIGYKIAAKPRQVSDIGDLAAAAAAANGTPVMPMVVNRDQVIVGSGISHANHLPRRIFEGYFYGQDSYFGSTEWVRNMDDIGTLIVAMPTADFQEMLNSGRLYDRARTFLLTSQYGQIQPIVWAHAVFEARGTLDPVDQDIYDSLEMIRYRPIRLNHIDNWEDQNEQDKD